jgi:hypothetical protein
MTGISLTVDARDLNSDVFPDGDIQPFLAHWTAVEPALRGMVLAGGMSFPVRVEDGEFTVQVIHPATSVLVDERTEFGIVAVRERPSVRGVYQCATCRRARERTYGPFICSECPRPDNRVCDTHAIVLPGTKTLAARCPSHQPACQGCGSVAAIWCPGPRCRTRVAWCRNHAAAHQSEPSTGYCLPCLDDMFPRCGGGTCDAVGSISCDHLDRDGRPCDQRRCPRHARRWQVFGPHAEGLGRCDDHAELRGLSAEGLLYQVLGACAVRNLPAPSLSSLRHMLMKLTARNRRLREVFALATAPPADGSAVRTQIGAVVDRRRARWWEEVLRSEGEVEQHTAQLQEWLNRQGNPQAAASVTGEHWVRPRDGRRGTLRVVCDARLLPRPWRDAASAALGFDVRLEGNR